MRILFISGVSVGGAPRSTVELADGLRARGHDVTVVVGDRTQAPVLYQLGVRAAVKTRRSPLARVITSALRKVGRRMHRISVGGSEAALAPIAVNAARRWFAAHDVDVVVANSLPRIEMSWALDDARAHGAHFILYLRETHAVTHFTVTGLRPDVVVANARSLAAELEGEVPCEVIPSMIDLSRSSVASTREAVLFVNPIPQNRPDLFLDMADRCPELPFVIQESWDLDPEHRRRLVEMCDARGNVELRRRTDRPADVYRDARVLVATYDYGRPRVVAEAQHNGIPVLAFDHPILAEAVGPGGVLISATCDADEAAAALRDLWAGQRYDGLSAAARVHAQRAELDAEGVVKRFEQILRSLAT